MISQEIFERVESKYLLTREQFDRLMNVIGNRITEDQYPHSNITSVYFDTPDYQLIRTALEKQSYREKLRLRSYGITDKSSTVFMEIKKKYDSVTYKRRQEMQYDDSLNYILFDRLPADTQIMREIDYIKNIRHKLDPRVLISYERDSWVSRDDSDLRITFDFNVRYSTRNLLLTNTDPEYRLTDDDTIIMEVKTLTSMPIWLTSVLNKMKIYPGNFSKYGQIYEKHLSKGVFKCLNSYSHQYLPNSQSQVTYYAL